MGAKKKIVCFSLGILTEVAVTWYNTYGETELWSNIHFFRISLVAAILVFLIKIIRPANSIQIAAYFSLGVALVTLGSVLYKLFLQDSTTFNAFPNTLLYILLAFAASFVGAFLGQLALKDKYK